MASWATIAGNAAPKAAPAVTVVPEGTVVVVDANALIAGVPLDRLGQNAVTVPEVLREIRDSDSRHRLATLPFGLDTHEPSEESMKAVSRFARATGDLAALSSVDLRLIALTRTLHAAMHGEQHLRDLPPPPVVLSKKARQAEQLPGWGEEGGSWSLLDNLPDAEDGGSGAGDGSRIAAAVQSLTLDGAEEEEGEATPGGVGEGLGQQQAEEDGSEDGDGDGADGNNDDGWEVAGKSKNAARRVKRKAFKRTAWEQYTQQQQQQPGEGGATLASPPQRPATPTRDATSTAEPAAAEPAAAVTGAAGVAAASDGSARHTGSGPHGGGGEVEEEGAEREAPAGGMAEDGKEGEEQRPGAGGGGEEEEEEEGCEGEDGSEGEGGDEDGVIDDGDDDEEGGDGTPEAACGPSPEGCFQPDVSIITADFAMQNVILQMGLRLVAPNGLRVTQLSRWVLRCTACTAVTKEVGRLFCPRCGNAALDRVRVVVGPDGAETYGVRKKHILRGTQFSLPKPRGGRSSKDVVLSEDVLMQRTARMRRQLKKKEEVDPFAPEYSEDSWFKLTATNTCPAAQQQQLAQAAGMTALLANWKRNPNERKGARRSNRRG